MRPVNLLIFCAVFTPTPELLKSDDQLGEEIVLLIARDYQIQNIHRMLVVCYSSTGKNQVGGG